jgi:predicted RNA methylase
MSDQIPLIEGTQRNVALSMWFTPPDLAKRIAEWAVAPLGDPMFVASTVRALEPSAGSGALAIPLRERVKYVVCVDVDAGNVRALRAKGFDARCEDFLEIEPHPGRAFDLVVMNPPFEGGQTEQHIMHALKFADRVVCHCPLTTLAGKARRENMWSKVQLHRLAICSSRPKYGAEGGKTDMCTIDVTLGEPIEGVEWWP